MMWQCSYSQTYFQFHTILQQLQFLNEQRIEGGGKCCNRSEAPPKDRNTRVQPCELTGSRSNGAGELCASPPILLS